MKLLISGFEPFGGDSINPSMEFLNWIKGKKLNCELKTILLPVSFNRSYEVLSTEIQKVIPTHIILTGFAKNRTVLTLEKIAINWVDARIPDNDGNKPVNQKILPDLPDGIFTSLPILEMSEASKKIGVEAKISYSAGEYVCNSLFYHTMAKNKCPTGFIHIPCDTNKISYETHFKGIETMINSLTK